MVVAEKVRLAVGSGTQRPSRFGRRTTVSAASRRIPRTAAVARGLVDTADAALYQAKAQGRDRWWPPADRPTARRTASARRAERRP
jgi:GGDEF domain-containing protein